MVLEKLRLIYYKKLLIMIKKISFFIISILVLISFFFSFFIFKTFFYDNTKFKEKEYELYIEPNADFNALTDKLKNVVKSIYYFSIASKNKGYHIRIKSGLYVIPKGSSNNDIINILRGSSKVVNVTFNNHERLENMAGRISKQIYLDSTTLVNSFYDNNFLNKKGFSLDTAIAMYLPNTYSFFWDTSAENFRNKMYDEYKKFWNNDRLNKAKLIGLSKTEISILASIVQKESIMKDERPKIAGVYLNRLKKRMRLQADPTVIFAIKNNSGDFKRKIKRVLYKDLKIKSPYNTYRNKGLPPGPICMPDLDAIDAILNSENHKYLYFVADPENRGYHLFGRNLREHNNNRKKYIRWINKKKIYR